MTATAVEPHRIRPAGASGRSDATRNTPGFRVPSIAATVAPFDPTDILAGMSPVGDAAQATADSGLNSNAAAAGAVDVVAMIDRLQSAYNAVAARPGVFYP